MISCKSCRTDNGILIKTVERIEREDDRIFLDENYICMWCLYMLLQEEHNNV